MKQSTEPAFAIRALSGRLRIAALVAATLAFVLIASSLDAPHAAIAGEDPSNMVSPATDACSLAPQANGCGAPLQSTQESEAEQQLAEKYAPIVYLKEQDEDCDRNGEAYAPTQIEIVLDNPDVALMLSGVLTDEVVMMAPSGSDLFDKGDGYYLDYPGDPRRPRCEYEEDYKALKPDYADVAYANIQREPGFPGFVLQYWLFFYFNDWNNTHEADWEMIQLVFEAETVEEALQQDPVRVGYAQHESGERADWDDSKLQKEDGRPVVYVARGGHPSQFDDAVYFGLGEDGAGFGCDDTSSPSVRVPLEARLIPDDISGPDDPFAWVEYEGQWGEKDQSFWNGPRGPKTKSRWHEPFTWEEELRNSSVKVPGGTTIAPGAIQGFCSVISFGSRLLNAFTRSPFAVAGSGGLVFLLLLGVVYLGRTTGLRGIRPLPAGASETRPLRRQRDLWHMLRASASIYRRNWPALLLIGAFYIPVGWVTSGLHSLISNNPPMEVVWRVLDEYPATEVLMTVLLGSAQAAAAAIIVTAAVVFALGEIDAGARGSARVAYRQVWQKLATLLSAYIRASFHIVLFALTVVGIPWAIQRTVRWYFLPQVIMLEDKSAKDSLSASADVVSGSWWRAFGITLVLGLIGALTGPAIAIFFLLFFSASVTFVNLISTVIYVMLIPFIATALTLLFYDLRTREAGRTSEESQQPQRAKEGRHE